MRLFVSYLLPCLIVSCSTTAPPNGIRFSEISEPASIKGIVSLVDPAPKPKKILFHDPQCPKHHLYEPVPVDAQNRIVSTLVYVKAGLQGKSLRPPRAPAVVQFHKCHLTPRLVALQVGQTLEIRNKDKTVHNAHGYAYINKEFNFVVPFGTPVPRVFTKPELGLKVKCDIHNDLSWICVLPNSFYSITDENGRYEIRGLPAGKYTVGVWQENCILETRDVVVKKGETSKADITLRLKPGVAR